MNFTTEPWKQTEWCSLHPFFKCCVSAMISLRKRSGNKNETSIYLNLVLVTLSQGFLANGYCLVTRSVASYVVPRIQPRVPRHQHLSAQFAAMSVVRFPWSPVREAG